LLHPEFTANGGCVRPSVRHTCDSRLHGLICRSDFWTIWSSDAVSWGQISWLWV